MKILFVSLGCDKNLVDSEEMLGALRERGYQFTDDEDEADAAIVNTCCFIMDAQKESIEQILALAERRTEGKLKALIVTGCMAQRYKEEVLREIPEVDAVIGTTSEGRIAEILDEILQKGGPAGSGGYLLVDGIPLHKTNIAIDPKTPVHTSDVAEVFRQQSHYPVASLKLGDMMDGKHALADKINALAAEGARIITFDCVTQEDLDLIADAAITSKQKFFCVDPGVFAASCARKIIKPKEKKEKHRILAVVGSVNPNTTAQMEELWLNQHPIYNVFVETKKLLESEEEREAEISRVTAAILEKALLNTVLTVTGDGIYPKNRIDFGPYMERDHCSMDEVTERINRSLAEIAWRILRAEPSIQGLYSSGGDVTQSIFRRFSAAGLMLRDEVLPLAAYGQFFGGDFDGLSIVTKGGSQGGPNAINVCVNYLKEKLYI